MNDSADVRPGGREVEDGDEVVIRRSAGGTAYFAPRSVRQATRPQLRCIEELQDTAGALAHGQEQLERLVGEARERGLSWNTIGWSIGVSAQAARQRWGS